MATKAPRIVKETLKGKNEVGREHNDFKTDTLIKTVWNCKITDPQVEGANRNSRITKWANNFDKKWKSKVIQWRKNIFSISGTVYWDI